VLVGSMNPDDGELRPQLVDRIGLTVDVRAPTDPAERAEVVTRRMAYDADPARFSTSWSAADEELAMKLGDARPASLPPELVRMVSNLCVRMGAEGLRGDLTVCRAAAALAGWERRRVAGVDDVRRVAPLALAHRCRRSPFEAPGIDQDELDRAVREGAASVPPPVEPPVEPRSVPPSSPAKSRRNAEAPAPAVARDAEPAVPVDTTRPRSAGRGPTTARLFVLAVDASSSAGAERRMEAAKGAVVGLLSDAYQRHHLIALVTFRGFAAEVILRPTSSVEVARARLTRLPTGGKTPLAEGIAAALRIATLPGRAQTHRPLLVLVSDGRATHANDGSDPLAAAMGAAGQVRAKGVAAVVLDPGNGTTRNAAPRQLAEAMGGRYELLAELSARELEQAVRQAATVLDGSP
jgi:magnesium chelatase subunit D